MRVAPPGPNETATVIEEGITARSGKIYIQTDRYPATPERLVHLFTVCARRGFGLANVTRQWISHNKNVLDAASGDPCFKDEFMELLRADSPEVSVLRRFYDYGLMTALIPELASVHGLVQHDQFHLYPVHEHHLRTVSELKKTIAGVYSEEEPELTVAAADLGDPAPMLLAGLLHDVGKSSGSGHALRGGEMIPAVARRLGLSSLRGRNGPVPCVPTPASARQRIPCATWPIRKCFRTARPRLGEKSTSINWFCSPLQT